MSRNQQIQNFIDALEQADGISVDADLTAESITIEDDDGDTAHITEGGRLLVSFPEPLDVSDATVPVTDDGTFDINSLPEPVDVSGSVVTVEDDGTFAIDSLPEPLNVSGATVTVTDDGAFNIAGSVDVSSLPEPLDVSGGTVTVTDDVAESLIVDNLTVPAGKVMFVPSGEEIGVMDLVVEDTATFVVDGYVEVFGDLTETGTITGTGDVTDRVL